MRSIAFATLGLGLCLALRASARADEWTKTFAVTGKPELRVETSAANIHVDTWDQSVIGARVTTEFYKIGDDGIKVFDHQTGDSVELEIRFPQDVLALGLSRRRVDIEVHMPREGRVNLRTGDGSIRLSNFKGNMELETVDGRQEIEAVDGVLRARSGNGAIRAGGRFDRLSLTSVDGRLEARALPGSTMGEPWLLQAGDGSVILQLPETFAADLDLATVQGHIVLDLPVAIEGKKHRNNIHGKLNGGGNLIAIRTANGPIRLEKL